MVWLKFVASLVIILFAGTKLARYGDALAEKTRLGQIWIGLVLLAFITSVPELSTGIGAVTLVSDKSLAPDLAIGTIMGSCIFNILIIAWLDMIHRREPVLTTASPNHMKSVLMGIILIGLAALSIFGGDRISGLALGWLGVPSIVVIIVYLIGVRWTLRSARVTQATSPQVSHEQYRDMGMREVWIKFILASGAVIGSGIWLALIGEEIANATGLGASFVGSLFLAVSTSMPEIALTTAAVRIGAVDMAVADVTGANMINIAKIFIIDIFYTDGSILASVSKSQITTALVAIGMSLVVLVGLRFCQRRKTFRVISWYGVVLIALYIYGAYALYNSGLG
ncbi:MAG TPA: sodium:calcium antiporter [Dehalococcoidia bacterium]|nr:sodium:calcium antiporter [Dehalococcoidia bacterium]